MDQKAIYQKYLKDEKDQRAKCANVDFCDGTLKTWIPVKTTIKAKAKR